MQPGTRISFGINNVLSYLMLSYHALSVTSKSPALKRYLSESTKVLAFVPKVPKVQKVLIMQNNNTFQYNKNDVIVS